MSDRLSEENFNFSINLTNNYNKIIIYKNMCLPLNDDENTDLMGNQVIPN